MIAAQPVVDTHSQRVGIAWNLVGYRIFEQTMSSGGVPGCAPSHASTWRQACNKRKTGTSWAGSS